MNPTLYVRINAQGARTGARIFIHSVDDMANAASRTGATLRSLHGTLAGLVGTFSTLQAIRNVVGEYARFEEAIATTRAVTQASTVDLKKMTDAARALGVTTKFSATDSADAMLVLAKAGLTAKQSIAATPAALKMAQMESMNLERAADILVGTMSQFSIAATETNRIMDVLVQASFDSISSVEELGHSLQYAGGFAAFAGVKFEESAAALATLADGNIRASMGGTNLRGVLAALVAPAREGQKALDRLGQTLGYTFRDFDPSRVGFLEALKRLKQTTITPADLETIFGRLHVSGAAIMIQQVEKIEDLYRRLEHSQGRSEEVFQGMTDTILGGWHKIRSVLKEINILIGESTFGVHLKEWVDRIYDALLVLVGFKQFVKGSIEDAEELAKQIRGVAAAAIFLGASLTALSIGAVVFATITNPVTALIVALAALAGAIAYNWDEMITFGDTSATVGDYVVATWDVVSHRFVEGWDIVSEASGRMWNYIKTSAKTVFDFIIDYINTTMAIADAVINTLMNRMAMFAANVTSLPQRLSITANQLSTRDFVTGQAAIKLAGDAAKHLMSRPGSQYGNMWEEVKGEIEKNKQHDYFAPFKGYIGANMYFLKKGFQTSAKPWYGIADEIQVAAKQRMDLRNAYPKPERPGFPELPPWLPPPEGQFQPPVISESEEDTRSMLSARRRFAEMVEDIQKEREWLFLSNQEREVRVKMLDAERLADQANLENRKEKLKMLEHELRLLQQSKQLQQIAQGVGDAFGDAFTEMVIGAQSAREAIASLAMAVSKLVIQQAAAQPLANFVTSRLGSAFGAFGYGGSAGLTAPIGPSGVTVTIPATALANSPQAAQGPTVIHQNFYLPNVKNTDDFKRSKSMLASQARSMSGGTM